MKRFLLFRFLCYYPDGGWNDFVGDFDTPEKCIEHLHELTQTRFDDVNEPRAEVIDSLTRECVATFISRDRRWTQA